MPQEPITVILPRRAWEALLSNKKSMMIPVVEKIRQTIIDRDVETYGLSSINHPRN